MRAKVDGYLVYTRWRNLHKTHDMEVGAIGFHNKDNVKRIKVEKDTSIVKLLNKTKEVRFVVITAGFLLNIPQARFPDLAALQEERAAEFRADQKQERRKQIEQEKAAKKEQEREKELRSYSYVQCFYFHVVVIF